MESLNKEKKYIYLGKVFLILFLFCAAFVSLPSTVTTSSSSVLPYLNFSKVTLFTILVGILFLVTLVLKGPAMSIDAISGVLLVRILLYFIPLFYIDIGQYALGNILSVAFSFLVFWCFRQCRMTLQDIKIPIIMFTFILCIQCIVAYFMLSIDYFDATYKYYMVIPIGATNYIAAILLPCSYVSILCMKSKPLKIVLTLLACAALFLTRSRTTLVIGVFFAIVLLVRYVFHNVTPKKMIFTILGFSVVLCVVAFNAQEIGTQLNKVFIGFADIYTGDSFLDTLLSGRLGLLGDQMKLWTDHLLFGSGEFYMEGMSSSHNFIMEILMKTGLVGFFVNLVLFILVFVQMRKRRSSGSIKILGVVLIIILCNALLEKTMFTSFMEIFMWMIAAVAVNESLVDAPHAEKGLL